MKVRKMASVFSIFIGTSMISMWIIFCFTDSIPELRTKPIELGMHIFAEILTATLLIIGAIGLLLKTKWGPHTYLVSMGMLLYTLIMSPGYFLQKGETSFVIMFALFIAVAIYFIIFSIIKNNEL